MNINELTIRQAKELATLFQNQVTLSPNDPGPWRIGKNYQIRTVTMINTGRLVEVYPTELVLEDAAWIPDTGRFANAVSTGNYSEVEPFPDGRVIIGRGSVIDANEIPSLQRSQK